MKVLDDPVPKPGGGDPYICMVVEYMVNMSWGVVILLLVSLCLMDQLDVVFCINPCAATCRGAAPLNEIL